MESSAQIKKEETTTTLVEPSIYPQPSKLLVAKVVLKLLPIVINLRRDRREWVKREGKNVNEEKYRRHARKVLKTFIELGPSYIKLGQWLSTRVDILPQPYLEVLSKLQDDVPPAHFSEVKPIIENELGKIEDAFEEFDTSPLSGASLGQVYLAKYAGKQVIVKVGRPNIERIIEDDIYVLKKILPLATRFIDPNLRFSAEGMMAQFIETVHEEMDYRIEAKNLLTIKHNLTGDPSVIIPDVFLDRTTRHVLTMKYVPGVKITDIARLDEKGIDREKLVVRVHRLFFKMLLRHDIFHADPHPGNISVAEDGRLILYDFGMVGRLDSETRIRLIRLYLGMLDKDPERTVNVLIELRTLEPTVNRYIVERGIALSIESLHGRHVDNMEVKALVELANKTMSRFPFRLPKNLALYMRMSSILEGIYLHHKVSFKFVKVLAGLLEEEGLVRDAYIEELKISAKRFVKGIQDSVNVAPMLKTYLETAGGPYSRQEKNNSALPASIFASALFIGSALMLPYNSYLAYGGFVAAAATVAVSLKKKMI
jgi:predicted unusual protein kinase regulating ubiquinone biosynthesis (AarF/ABC1/UbiB family)